MYAPQAGLMACFTSINFDSALHSYIKIECKLSSAMCSAVPVLSLIADCSKQKALGLIPVGSRVNWSFTRIPPGIATKAQTCKVHNLPCILSKCMLSKISIACTLTVGLLGDHVPHNSQIIHFT